MLFAVHLDAHEVIVEIPRDNRILERLMCHHMAPVACGVSNGNEHRDIAFPGFVERLLAPRQPIDRIVGMLKQIGTRRRRELIGHTAIVAHSLSLTCIGMCEQAVTVQITSTDIIRHW